MTEPLATISTVSVPAAADIAGRLRIAIARITHQLRPHGPRELTPTRVTTLVAVEQHGPLRLGDLAAQLGIAVPTVSRIVDGLRELALLNRVPDPSDHRACQIQLSADGRAWLADLRSRSNSTLAQHIQQLTVEEAAALAAALPVLEKLSAGTTRVRPSP